MDVGVYLKLYILLWCDESMEFMFLHLFINFSCFNRQETAEDIAEYFKRKYAATERWVPTVSSQWVPNELGIKKQVFN